ncbi:hypothetical protein B0H14DRAFT_3614279 [Mycena olivaceomarginata]|nr:hypothetical protein B0H14DRAFT_3614279 [Mycena olivaceomarginata]
MSETDSGQNPWPPFEWTPEQAAEIASWELEKERGPRTWIYGDWYNDPNIPAPWSTNWERWDGLRLYEEKVGGKPKIDVLFKDVFDVPGKVEPLAYHTTAGDEFFLFAAGGRYYFWEEGYLTVHRNVFGSPKEFLDYVLREGGNYFPDLRIEARPGANLLWWP